MTGPSAPAPVLKSGPPSDADLIAAARRGDNVALDTLIGRHRAAAARLAGRLAPDSADVVLAEAVGVVAATLRAGGGPVVAFRPYLLTTVRRRNHARAAAAGRVRPVDDLGTERLSSIAGSSVTPAALPAAAAAYRRMSELTRTALWHTEVDGEELAATAVVVGMPATEVAELAFRGREAFRQGTLGAHLGTAPSPACRWAAERFGALSREALPGADAAKVQEHLSGCGACTAAYPAIEAVENDLTMLLAMLVLGPAAGPYLGRDVVAAGRNRGVALASAGRGRALLGAGGRPVAVLGVGVFLAAGGLVTSLALAGDNKPTNRAAQAPPVAAAQAERGDGSLLESEGPDYGSASAGGERTRGVERDSAPAAAASTGTGGSGPTGTTTPVVIRESRSQPTEAKPRVTSPERPAPAEEPEASPAQAPAAEERRVLADLGVVQLAVTPEGGLLGLPGIGLLPPGE